MELRLRRVDYPTLKMVHARLTSLCVNLMRLEEVKSFRLPQELDLRASMIISDMKEILEHLGDDAKIPREVSESVNMVRAYAYISTREGVDFVTENSDRILRAVRWCISSLERYLARR